MKIIRQPKLFVAITLLCCIFAAPAFAKYEKELIEVDRLIKGRKYASAAEFISKRKLKEDPRFTRRYVHILARKYIQNINFSIFAMKNLKPGEKVRDLRGKTGMSRMYMLDMDKFLFKQIKKHPNSPDIKFAIGDYLSSLALCGCNKTKNFSGKTDQEYYEKAYKAGLYDYWSLFRMGLRYLGSNKNKELDKAISLFKRSRKLNSGHIPTTYNLAIAYYFKGEDITANRYITMVLGKYGDAFMDADTYNVHARINMKLGRFRTAEESFRKALSYYKTHRESFSGLLYLYKKQGRNQQYINTLKRYIAQDFSDHRLFDHYAFHLQEYRFTKVDHQALKSLSTLKPKKPYEIGIFNFSIGKLYHGLPNKIEARKFYIKALTAFKSMKKPSIRSIKVVEQNMSML